MSNPIDNISTIGIEKSIQSIVKGMTNLKSSDFTNIGMRSIMESFENDVEIKRIQREEDMRKLAKLIVSQSKNDSDLSDKTITTSPNEDATEVILKRLFTWYAEKKEEYETLQKDIMEGKKDKELWIATLKVDREKYKDEMERLKEIDNSSNYRTFDKQFNTDLYKQTDKIIIELEKWQTYLNEGKAEIERIPEWVKKLIDDCIIGIDGKTVITNNLDKVAIAIGEQGKSVTKEILKRFIKKDGKPYSSSSLTQALCAVNLGNSSKKTTKKL